MKESARYKEETHKVKQTNPRGLERDDRTVEKDHGDTMAENDQTGN